MKKKLICIVCPNGCEITAETDGSGKVISVEGQSCSRGRDYAVQEMTDPRRTLTTSIRIEHGQMPLASVRLTAPVPKDMIFKVMDCIRKIRMNAPVKSGTVAVRDILGLGADLIITRDVPAEGTEK